MNTSSNYAIIGCMALLCGIPFGLSLAADSTTPGIFQKHEYRFSFIGFTTTYSCDGLADKLKLLLLAAGARADAKAAPAACAKGFGRPDKFASAYLTFYTLATPGADRVNDSPMVDGSWRPVKFMPRSPSQLGLGDCELIEQFRDHVLPMFTVRDIDDKTTCVPHQVAGSGYSLAFESLAPPPKVANVKGN
jgi:hypothetical protein